MTFEAETRIACTRKQHRCSYCGHTIPKGSAMNRKVGSWNGYFYTTSGHEDCAAMWAEAYPIYADYEEGMDADLIEAIGMGEGDDHLIEELNGFRGRYPHVVTRLEFRIQKSDIAYATRCRAHGFEPDPCDCEPVYG